MIYNNINRLPLLISTAIIFILVISPRVIDPIYGLSESNSAELNNTNREPYQPLFSLDHQTRASLHGNDWIDTFDDYSGLESFSNINISSGQARLELDSENEIFTDDFSTVQLDSNKWNGQTSGGIQLVPSPVLMALKLNEAQSNEAFIMTDDYWSLERVVEWDWNSVLEGGYGTYDHIICPFHSSSDTIWVKIRGDRRVTLGSNTYTTSDPTYTITENQWYHLKCKISSTNVVLTISNETGVILNIQEIDHEISGFGNFKITFASQSANLASFDIRMDDVVIKGGYKTSASFTSIPIILPEKYSWDAFGLSKSEPDSTILRISILDAGNDQVIQGYQELADSYLDISSVDPVAHPSLKIFATLDTGIITSTPKLFQWGISWVGKNSWQDTFIGTSKTEKLTNLIVEDGEVRLEKGETRGRITSNPITLVQDHFWNSIVIEKSESSTTSIKVTVIDYNTNSEITVIESPATLINIFSIDPVKYPVIKLKADFIGTDFESPVLYRWNLNWSKNTLPGIITFQPPGLVYRTETVEIFAKCYDTETPENELNLQFQYKSPSDINWQTSYLSNLKYFNNYWVVDFTPVKNAEIGNYSIKLICLDTFGGNCYEIYNNAITVLNNKPNKPELKIEPIKPTSANNLECLIITSSDPDNDFLSFTYEWYRENVLEPSLTSGSVPAGYTLKNERWKCKVTPNDGIEDGESAEIEVQIGNSPPEAINPPYQIYINEDIIDSTSINLSKYFVDRDGDKLKYFKSGDINISVTILAKTGQVILKPDHDWTGNEKIKLLINDSLSEIEYFLSVSVLPVNDPPVIEKVNNILVTNKNDLTILMDIGQELIFDVKAYDIDSDDIEYSLTVMNNSEGTPDNLILNEELGQIWYKPTSHDVGTLNINVTVSDNDGGTDWKIIKIKVLEEDKPWYELDFQTLILMGLIVLLIIVLISGFLFVEWRKIKKRKEAEFEKAQQSEDKYHPDQQEYSVVELLKILNWRYSRHEIDRKTYKELKKAILEMRGQKIQVNQITSPLFATYPEVPASEPAMPSPPVITESTQQFVPRFDLPKLPPAPDPEDEQDS
jgi:hypothetical protein